MILDDIQEAIVSQERKPSVVKISKNGYEEILRDERSINQPYFGSDERHKLIMFGVLVKVEDHLDKPFELID